MDYGFSVQQTSDGGYIIAGKTDSFGAGGDDFYLVKTDAKGDTIWTRTYGGYDWDVANSVQQTSDGGYIIAGGTYSFGAGEYDIYLVKTDSIGNTLWTRTYGGSGQDVSYCVQQTSDGGYIISGAIELVWTDNYDVWLIKTDASGDDLWTRTYGGDNSDERGRCVQQTTDGGYIIAGHTGSGAGLNDVYLVKTDAGGNTLWTRTYGGSSYDNGYFVQQTTDGGYIISGTTKSFGPGEYDAWLLKTDANGDTLWTRIYGDIYDEYGWCVQQTTDGGYIVAGTVVYNIHNWDVYLLKTDANGDTLWTRTYGGWDRDMGYSVQQTTDGGYIVAGCFMGPGSVDVWLLKLAGEPEISMSCQNLTPIFCRGKNLYFKLTVGNRLGENISGTLTFSGYSGYDCDPMNVLVSIPRTKTYPPGITEEYYHFKVPSAVGPGQYSASVGGTLGDADLFCCMNVDIVQCEPWKTGDNTDWELVEIDRPDIALPTVTELYQNYPNPFNAQTNIGFSLAEAGNVTLEVYDIGGRLVTTLVDGHQKSGEHKVTWDGCDLASGVYFYKLTAGDYTETRRMMLVK